MELRFSGSIQELPDARRLELLLDALTDYAVYLVDAEGVIRSWNLGAEKVYLYRAGEVIGQHFSLFFRPEDRAADFPGQLLTRARLTGRAEHEAWRVRKDGTRFWVTTSVQPVRAHNGRAIGFAVVTRDITERRQARTRCTTASAAFACWSRRSRITPSTCSTRAA
jgi:PAS domain S-box-containing protein